MNGHRKLPASCSGDENVRKGGGIKHKDCTPWRKVRPPRYTLIEIGWELCLKQAFRTLSGREEVGLSSRGEADWCEGRGAIPALMVIKRTSQDINERLPQGPIPKGV